MKSKNKSIATVCILLFHLGLLYMVYQQIASPQANTTTKQELQQNRP